MSHLKYIKNLIEKTAQDFPVRKAPKIPSSNSVPAASAPSDIPQRGKSNVVNKPVTSNKDAGIEAMQTALSNLSKKFMSQRTAPSADPTKPTRKSFADFISGDSGNAEMAKAMQEMQKLNDPKGAQFPIDGKWGPKTFDALDGVAKFGQAILKIASDFRLQSKVYSDESLADFQKFISNRAMTPADKVKNAPVLTQHIEAISTFYTQLMTTIMSSQAMRQQIEGMAESQEKKSIISPQLLNALDSKYKNFKVTITTEAGVGEIPIEVKNFADLNALMAWKKAHLPPEIPLSTVVNQLKEQISKIQ